MIEKYIKYLQKIDRLPVALRVASFLVLIVVVFILWQTLLWSSAKQNRALVTAQIATTKQQVSGLQSSLQQARQSMAQLQPASTNGKAKSGKNYLGSSQQILGELGDLFKREQGLELLSLQNKPIREVKLSGGNITLFQYGIVIKFKGGYFTTLHFIQDLENLDLPIFWDQLDYKVETYPNAEVTLEVHTLSEQGEGG